MAKNLTKDSIVRFITLICMFGWTTAQTINHAMWRDEAHSWLIARNATSPLEIITLTQYEGRQPMWYVILWIFIQITTNFELAKLIVILFNFLTFLLLIFWAKVNSRLLILILSGFLFAGGYTTLLRDYVIELFLLSIFITLKRRGAEKYLLFVVIGILAWINAFSLVIAISIFFAEISTNFKLIKVKNNLKTFFSILFASVSICASIFFIKPKSDNPFQLSIQINLYENFSALYYKITLSFFPFISELPSRNPVFISFAIFSALILLAFLYVNWKVDKYIFWLSSIGIFLFSINYMFGYAYYWWHFGNLFLLFLISALITKHKKNSDIYLKLRNLIFITLFISQIFANFGYPGNTLFTSKPYSNAKKAAEFIDPICSKNCTLVTNNLFTAETISAYLNGRPLFNAKTKSFETFSVWGKNHEPETSWTNIISQAKNFENPVIVVNNLNNPPPELQLLGKFDNAVWIDEKFDIYVLR